MITVGMLPWVTGWQHLSGFLPAEVAKHVDFLSVHIYPKTKKPAEAPRERPPGVEHAPRLAVREPHPQRVLRRREHRQVRRERAQARDRRWKEDFFSVVDQLEPREHEQVVDILGREPVLLEFRPGQSARGSEPKRSLPKMAVDVQDQARRTGAEPLQLPENRLHVPDVVQQIGKHDRVERSFDLIQPVRIGNREYVDGGLVSPVPVRVARQMGAELIIAVDISSPPDGQPTGDAMRMLLQTFAIMGRSINHFELREAEVVIRPKLDGVGSADFTARKRSIQAGRDAALAALTQVRQRIALLSQGHLIALGTPAEVATQVGGRTLEDAFIILQERDEREPDA